MRNQTTPEYNHNNEVSDAAGSERSVRRKMSAGGIVRADALIRALVILPHVRAAAIRGKREDRIKDGSGEADGTHLRSAQAKLDEAVGLALAIDLDVAETIMVYGIAPLFSKVAAILATVDPF